MARKFWGAIVLTVCLMIAGCSSGDGGDSAPTPRLRVRAGANNPGSVQTLAVASDVSVLQLELEASGGDVDVSSIRFHASGSGDDQAAVLARLYRDTNGDGAYDAGDAVLGPPETYPQDDGAVVFALIETIPAGAPVQWLLVYDLAAGPAAGRPAPS